MHLYPTDWGLFTVLTLIVFYAVKARRTPDLRQRWGQVFSSSSASGAAVVIAIYFGVAIIDSIRLDNDGSTLTVLDLLVTPLRTQVERTYSAPFAAHGFLQESHRTDTGEAIRAHPRLRHGGSHLADPNRQKRGDVLWRGGIGIIAGLSVWGVGFLLLKRRLLRLGIPHDARKSRLSTPVFVTAFILAGLGFLISVTPYYHVCGTDKVGADVLYRALKSIRTGLTLGILTLFIALPVAVILGLLAGYFRGWIDDVIQYFYTTLASVPGVLLIAAGALTLDVALQQRISDQVSVAERADLRLLGICLVLGLTSWTSLCRLLRAEVMKLRTLEYVLAARSLGAKTAGILWRHLIPNTLHIVIVTSVIDFSGIVLAEAVLTYIDIGVDPSTESWGNMINSARLELAREPVVWWSLGTAFIFMFGLVLAANLFADAVRDAFDPHLRMPT